MKKLILIAVLAAVLRLTGLLPFESSDVAELLPVEALTVSVQGDTVTVRGKDCMGVGADWESALHDLTASGSGRVFLGTAEQIVLCGDAVRLLQQVAESEELRPGALICACPSAEPAPEEAAEFLKAHPGSVTLQQVRALQYRPGELRLPELMMTEGGLRLVDTPNR